MSNGSHSVTVKAWDNFNNSSEASITFKVEPDDKFIVTNLINYPNPFQDETRITAEHNRPDNEFDVTVNIFSLDGRIIKVIKTSSHHRVLYCHLLSGTELLKEEKGLGKVFILIQLQLKQIMVKQRSTMEK